MRQACYSGAVTLVANTWLGDRIADDRAVSVNSTDCNNFDGDSTYNSTLAASYCCLEWMKY
jgi:hypothetical protein